MDFKAILKMSFVIAFLNALYVSGAEIDFVFVVIVSVLFIACFNCIHAKLYDRYDSTIIKVIKIVFSLGVSCCFIYLLGKLYFFFGFSLPPLVEDIFF